MTIDILNKDMITAWKAGDMPRKSALANMIDAVKKASMTSKGRVEITEALVDETLIKYQKTVQEQYDACPATEHYMSRRLGYCAELSVVKEYAPQLLTNPEEIKEAILTLVTDISMTKANRGSIMKVVASGLKGKADMSVVNRVVGELLV